MPDRNVAVNSAKSARPTLEVDYALYEKYLDDTDLTEAQKHEMIDGLWRIICDFVAIGFHVHPVQQAVENCGQAFANARGNKENPVKSDIYHAPATAQEGPSHD